MTTREQLFFLLGEYKNGKYTIPAFCDAFETVFYPDVPRDELACHELELFEMLGETIVRYTPYADDFKNYPGVYKSEAEVKLAIEVLLSNLS